MNISEDRLKKALTYLAETDEPAAKAKALSVGLDEQRKSLRAILFTQKEGSQGLRAELAMADPAYIEHLEKLQSAVYEYETLRNKRLTESLIVEVWRSEQANRRAGNI